MLKNTCFVLAAAVVLAGCQCGPGVTCSSNTECEPWGQCGTNGFCVTKAPENDGGFPKAVVPATEIDFGLVGCGSAVAVKTISITNSGTKPLNFSTDVTNPGTYMAAPPVGQLLPDETAMITVSGLVPGSSAAKIDYPGVLTITTNDPVRKKIDVPLKLKSAGVTLKLVPGVATFSPSPINEPPQELPLALTNEGNIGTLLTLAQPTDPQFSLRWAGSDAGTSIFVDAGLAIPGLVATYKAGKIGPSDSFSSVSFAESSCGTGLSVIPMSGRGESGQIVVSDSALVFGAGGRVACGTTAPAKTFTIRNTGNRTFSWIAALGKGAASPFTVMPTNGAIFGTGDAGVTVTVTPNAIPQNASTVEDAFGDVLTLTTDIAGDPGRSIALNQTASGAVFTLGSPSVDFGLVPLGDTASAPVTVSNAGNAPAAIAFSSNHPKFSMSPTANVTVDGGSAFGFVARYAPDAAVGPEQAQLTMTSDAGVLCAPLPAALAASGAGSTGSVSYTPVGLDFGTVNCGAAAAAQTVTFKNNGNQAYTIFPALSDGGSSFTWTMSPDSGIVAADGGTAVITVTPKPIPMASPVTVDLYGDTLTVTTDVANDAPHPIALRMTAQGAIFGISSNAIAFGAVAVGGSGTSQFTVDNTGNLPGKITFAPTAGTVFSLPRDAGVLANASITATATFTPQVVTVYTDTAAISVSADTVLCAPLPFTSMGLSGQGTASNGLAVSPNNLTFGTAGFTACGTTAPAKTVTITNSASVPLALTLTFAINDGGSPYTVSGPAFLGPGDAGTVTVTPKAIPATSSTAPDFYADTLSIRAVGGPVNETHSVALHQTAQGAILTFNPTALSFTTGGLGGSQQKNFTVSNSGNLAAAYTLAIGGANPGQFSVNPTSSSVSPGMGVTETVTFVGELLAPQRTGNVSLSTSVARCAPLPAPVQLTGN